MDLSKLRSITNCYQDVRLVSLQTWRRAAEIIPRDNGGPYVITQEGYDPNDPTVTPDEFILGKSGKWVSLGFFYKMPQPERREEYVFGRVAEVMQLLEGLPSKPAVMRPGKDEEVAPEAEPVEDELTAAVKQAKKQA
jgi:hypothetical protein